MTSIDSPKPVRPPVTVMNSRLHSASTLLDYMNAAVRPYLSAALISPNALSNIGSIAALLPGALTDFFGFECPLGAEDAKADFLICAQANHGGRAVLADHQPGDNLPEYFHQSPVWRGIGAFSRAWADPMSVLSDKVHNIWIEFDVDHPSPRIPIPSVFIGANTMHPLVAAFNSDTMPEHCRWLTDTAVPMLLANKLESGTRSQIARCLNHLPEGAHIFQVGLMLARKPHFVRACIRGISATQLLEYIQALNWEGPFRDLVELVTMLEPLVLRFDLDLG